MRLPTRDLPTRDLPTRDQPTRGPLNRSPLGSPVVLSRLALASVIANVGIVGTGGAVRLTGSGLGCPTVPRCSDTSYTPTPELGIHGVIEFSNRMLTFVVGLIAVAGLLAAFVQRRHRPGVVTPAALVLASIPAQAVLGAVTVLTHLNPWVVGCHFLVSMAVIAAAYTFWRRTTSPPHTGVADAPVADAPLTPVLLRRLAVGLTAVAAAVLILGTMVTGSGPHAGDVHARRNGLDLQAIAQLHADAVFALVGMSVALWFALRAVGARTAARTAGVLVGVELAQGLIGFVQYATHLPIVLVGAHMLGASLVWLATVAVLAETRHRTGASAAAVPAQQSHLVGQVNPGGDRVREALR